MSVFYRKSQEKPTFFLVTVFSRKNPKKTDIMKKLTIFNVGFSRKISDKTVKKCLFFIGFPEKKPSQDFVTVFYGKMAKNPSFF